MAIRTGILGFIKQTADGITFSKWKDKNVMKRKNQASSAPPTEAQLAVRRRFAILVPLMRLCGGFLRLTFKAYLSSQTAYNAFMSFNYANTTDNGSEASITYNNLVISKGSVLPMTGTTAATGSGAAKTFLLTWDDNTNGTTGLSTDVMGIVVIGSDGSVVEFIDSGVTRDAETYTATVSSLPAASAVEVYPFFARADDSAFSDNTHADVTTHA